MSNFYCQYWDQCPMLNDNAHKDSYAIHFCWLTQFLDLFIHVSMAWPVIT